jgi:serine/threonine protein kinase
MTGCPSDDQLAGLLADAVSPAERDTLARHVERCVACQAKLARLTGTPDTEMWQRAEGPLLGSEAEERVVRHLKRMPPLSSATLVGPAASLAGPSPHADAPLPAAAASEWPAVPGYEILGELGRGGMGVVYRARQLALQRTVALKMFRTATHAGAKDLARFRAEAEVLARLQHPNIVQIYDVGEVAGRPYFALEFVPGGSLAVYLNGKPQPVRAAAQLVETLARAVQAAHASGVVHRDLKPANILLSFSREPPASAPAALSGGSRLNEAVPKITDFGLAKCVGGDGEAPGQRGPTVTGELLGTPNYMAPEQAAIPRQPVGPAADVYALGAILYELLTGRPPFAGETPLATVLQVLHSEPVSVIRLQPNVPRDLETICLKCLQKEPRKRYGSALELAEDLHRFLTAHPIRARPPSTLYLWGKFAQRHRALVAGVAGVLVALILGALAAGLVALRESAQRQRAEDYARQARQDRDEAQRQAYYACLAAAGAALRDDDVAAAARHLRDAPKSPDSTGTRIMSFRWFSAPTVPPWLPARGISWSGSGTRCL